MSAHGGRDAPFARATGLVGLMAVLACGAALLACGGGGGSSSSAPPPPMDDGSDGDPSPAPTCGPLYSCTAEAGATEVFIVNNCGGTQDVTLAIVESGTQCNDTVQPSCIQNLDGSGGSVWLLGTNTANAFHVGPYGSSTIFEVTHDASGQDWFDISQNQGFDIGMTAVPPGGDVPYVVCTTQNCPGAYPFGDSACETNPCLQPNYLAGATGGKFELYLCNQWPDDPRPAADRNLDTPGPLGCSYNQGTCISPTDATCPADSPGHDSRPEDLPCQWGHPVPGQANPGHGTCPLGCPTPFPTPLPTPTP
jgi:hypothetical protein